MNDRARCRYQDRSAARRTAPERGRPRSRVSVSGRARLEWWNAAVSVAVRSLSTIAQRRPRREVILAEIPAARHAEQRAAPLSTGGVSRLLAWSEAQAARDNTSSNVSGTEHAGGGENRSHRRHHVPRLSQSVSDMNAVSLAGTRQTREGAGRTSGVGHPDITSILRRGPDLRDPRAPWSRRHSARGSALHDAGPR